MPNVTGGCLCGRIRYTISADPLVSGLCHCRDCQRYTGSAFEPWMVFPAEAVSLTGTLQSFDMAGSSGKSIRRRFCPNCGSGVLNTLESAPDRTVILVGTLDDPTVFAPTTEIYCHSAQPWLAAGAARKRYDKSITRDG